MRLAQIDDPEVPGLLAQLETVSELLPQKEWIGHLLDENVARNSDLSPWDPDQVRSFVLNFEKQPKTDDELYDVARWRLLDIKREIEFSDNSLRDEVHADWDERALRRWLQRKLMEPHRCRGRYTVPEEAEVDFGKRPDLRFENPNVPSAVPVEIKWADRGWTLSQLLERLENQLVGQYMRAHNINYGIYLLANFGRKEWKHPSDQRAIGFMEVAREIERRANEIQATRKDLRSIHVVTIDFVRGAPSATEN